MWRLRVRQGPIRQARFELQHTSHGSSYRPPRLSSQAVTQACIDRLNLSILWYYIWDPDVAAGKRPLDDEEAEQGCRPFADEIRKSVLVGLLYLVTRDTERGDPVFSLAPPNCPEGQEFDPVEHFDLSRCTVTIDSQCTDMGMKNYSAGTWDEIRTALEEVPLSYPFWRVDPKVGLFPWIGELDRRVAVGLLDDMAETPLVPIEHWTNGDSLAYSFKCDHCEVNDQFQTAGQLRNTLS
ncbi:uncharacterized protein B0T15DRAFT_134015 [Chaetomium strumarium]|uniref:Uncharacterized protein n=1 Tax=Chaetomium strumarium TaxID=1170767 RepID=A0AAJ0GZW5_9PEZI|nr:hypothetical protein B0T15DRAFT_134015 [Chaetomium strumarium]